MCTKLTNDIRKLVAMLHGPCHATYLCSGNGFTQLVWLLPERAWPALIRLQTCVVRVVRWLQWATALVNAMSLQLLWCQQVVVQAAVIRYSLGARIWPDFRLVDARSLHLLWCQQVSVQATVVRCSLGARIQPDFHMRSTDIIASTHFLTWSLSKAILTHGNVPNLHASHEPTGRCPTLMVLEGIIPFFPASNLNSTECTKHHITLVYIVKTSSSQATWVHILYVFIRSASHFKLAGVRSEKEKKCKMKYKFFI
jgi:hypothetical protein